MEGRGTKVVGTVPPLAALPSTVAPIVTATHERGEVWLVSVAEDGSATFAQVATSFSPKGPGAMYANMTLMSGRVHRVTAKLEGEWGHAATISKVRDAFGPKVTRRELEEVAS
jgi:hypothetical protein